LTILGKSLKLQLLELVFKFSDNSSKLFGFYFWYFWLNKIGDRIDKL